MVRKNKVWWVRIRKAWEGEHAIVLPPCISNMENNYLHLVQAIGIGGVFALIVLDKVFEFINKKKPENGKVLEIHIALTAISKAVERQTIILDRMYQDCSRCREEMSRISGKLTK